MSTATEKNILALLKEYKDAKKAYFDAVGITDSFKTPEPAKENEIKVLESKLGQKLPASYREFLKLQDGFPEFDGETNILSVQDMSRFYGDEANAILQAMEKKYGDESFKNFIIFGRSSESLSMYLFDPTLSLIHI